MSATCSTVMVQKTTLAAKGGSGLKVELVDGSGTVLATGVSAANLDQRDHARRASVDLRRQPLAQGDRLGFR